MLFTKQETPEEKPLGDRAGKCKLNTLLSILHLTYMRTLKLVMSIEHGCARMGQKSEGDRSTRLRVFSN